MLNPFRSLTLLALTLALGVARSDWKSLGPSGGYAFNLKVIGGNLFAITGSGIWRSADGGSSWTWVQSSDPAFIADLDGSGQNLFAVNDGVFRSTNGGVSWDHLAITVPQGDEISMRVGQSVKAMGRFLLDGTSSGIFRSSDNGVTWTRVDGYDAGYPLYAYSLAVQGSRVYAGTSYGLFASTDSGAAGSWKIVTKSQDGDGDVGAPAVMGRYLFLDGYNGLTRSANQGRTWETVDHGSGRAMLATGNVLYRSIATSVSATVFTGALYRSLDSGATWVLRNEGNLFISLAARGDTLFASSENGGVEKSIDSGKHFEPCPIPVSNVPSLSAVGNRILAPGGQDQGDFVSADGGETWTLSAAPRAATYFTHMAVNGSLGFAVDFANHTFVSKDSGLTWKPAPAAFAPANSIVNSAQSVAIHAGAFFLAIRDGLYRSMDSGTTWTPVRPENSRTFLGGVILYTAGPEIQLWDQTGIFRSIDTGAHWVAAHKSPTGIMTGISEGRDGIYAVGRDGVFRSGDRGDTWTLVNGDSTRFHFLAAVEGALLASNDSLGMFVSKDGGADWKAFNSGLPDHYHVVSLSVSATHAFIGVANAGIWRRPLAELAAVTGLARPTPEREAQSGLRLVRTGSGIGIEFSLSRPGWARLEVFDIHGRRLAVLAAGRRDAGKQSVMLPAGVAQAGIRILRLQAEGKVLSRVAAE